jgi:membrane-associated protein
MGGLVDALLPYVLTYKYVALFIITFFGALLLPLPSGTIIAAATAFGTQGYMNPWAVLIVGILGNVAGDNTGYWLARRYGTPVLERLGFRKLLHADRFVVVEKQIADHPFLTIFWSRYLTAIAPTVNIIAGLGKVRYRVYLFFEFWGEVAEVGTNFLIGYAFGENWEYFSKYLDNIWIVVVGGFIISFLIWKWFEKRHRRLHGHPSKKH